jgi:hypothetical protein
MGKTPRQAKACRGVLSPEYKLDSTVTEVCHPDTERSEAEGSADIFPPDIGV